MHLNDKPVCQSPLLRNPLQVERHQGLGCGGCIFLFIIDVPDPDRQHTTHVIWIHFGFRCMPSSGLDSEPSLCGGGNQRVAAACVSVRLRKRVIYNGPTLCFPAPSWLTPTGCPGEAGETLHCHHDTCTNYKIYICPLICALNAISV